MKTVGYLLFSTVLITSAPAAARQCVRTTNGGFGLKPSEICGGATVEAPAGTSAGHVAVLNSARLSCQARFRERTPNRVSECKLLLGEAYNQTRVPEAYLMLAKEMHTWEAYEQAYDAYKAYCTAVPKSGREAPPCCAEASLAKLRGWLRTRQYFKVKLAVEPDGARVLAERSVKKRDTEVRLQPAGYYCVPYDTVALKVEKKGFLTETRAVRNDWGAMVDIGQTVVLRRPAMAVAVRSNVPGTRIVDPYDRKELAVTPQDTGGHVELRFEPRGAGDKARLWAVAEGYPRTEFEVSVGEETPRVTVEMKPPTSAVIDVAGRAPGTRFYLRSDELEVPEGGAPRRVVLGTQRYTVVASSEGSTPVEVPLDDGALVPGAPHAVAVQASPDLGLFVDVSLGLTVRDYGDSNLATTPSTELGLRLGYAVARWQRWAIVLQAGAVYTPASDQSAGDTGDIYHLVSALGGAGLRFKPLARVWIELGFSAGALMVVGVDSTGGSLLAASPDGEATTVVLPTFRPHLAAALSLWRGLYLGATVAGELSPRVGSDLSDDIGTLRRMSFSGTLGWGF